VIDNQMEGEMRVTVIATGFEDADSIIGHQERPALKKVIVLLGTPNRLMIGATLQI